MGEVLKWFQRGLGRFRTGLREVQKGGRCNWEMFVLEGDLEWFGRCLGKGQNWNFKNHPLRHHEAKVPVEKNNL